MLSTFSRTVPSRVYEMWIFLICFLVICIILHLTGWNLIPHFLAQHPNWSISFWNFNVSAVSLISQWQTQSSAKSLISDSMSVEISLMYKGNNKGPKTVPCGTPDKTGAQSDFAPFTTTRCWAINGPNSVASSFRTLGWSSSGSKALEGFKGLRSLVTPSFETIVSSMKGANQLRNVTSLWSLLLNTSVNWPLNSSAYSISEAEIPVPPLLLFRKSIHPSISHWPYIVHDLSKEF